MDAIGLAALIDAIETIIGANARADFRFPPRHDLANDVWVGHVGAGHSDHVDLPRLHRMPCRCDIGDAGGMERRQPRRRADFASEVEMRSGGHALDRDKVRQTRIGVDMAADDVEKIDEPALRQPPRNLEPILPVEPAFLHLVHRIANADDEIRPDATADLVEHLEDEAHAVAERAAIGFVQRIGQWRPELVEEMAIGFQLDAVEPGGLHAFRGVPVILDDTRDVPILELLREGAMRRFAMVRGGDHGQPVTLVPARAPAEVAQLDHYRRAMLVAGIGQVPHPGHDLVLEGEDIVEHRRAVPGCRGGASRHGQGNAALGARRMIGAVARLRHAVLRVGRFMSRCHDPVPQGEVLDRIGLQQRIARGHSPGSERMCRG